MTNKKRCYPEKDNPYFRGITQILFFILAHIHILSVFLNESCASRGIRGFSPPPLKISIYFDRSSLIVEGTGIRKLELCIKEGRKEREDGGGKEETGGGKVEAEKERMECAKIPLSSSSFLPSKVKITEPQRAKRVILVIYGFKEKRFFLIDFSERNFRLLRVFSRPSLSSQGRTQYAPSHA